MASELSKFIEKELRAGKGPTMKPAKRPTKSMVLFGIPLVLAVCAAAYYFHQPAGDYKYAVVFDAGSTGSRVHVFEFEEGPHGLVLKDELFEALKPGLKEYATDPKRGAESLIPLLDKSKARIPKEKWATTKLSLRATAGLRLLPEGPEAADALMREVKLLLQTTTDFIVEDDHVSIITGAVEGAFGWVTVNYLLQKLGKGGLDTVAVADLGGGSVQIMFVMPDGVDAPPGYVQQLGGLGKMYNVYVKSYNGYGIMAARAKILSTGTRGDGTHPCAPLGFDGGCSSKCYGLKPGEGYQARSGPGGGDFDECVEAVKEALNMGKPCEEGSEGSCTFDGVWAPKVSTKLYAMSYFYERAEQSHAATPAHEDAQMSVTPKKYADAGRKVCQTPYADILSVYPDAEKDHYPYLCLDSAYVYTLLTQGWKLGDGDGIELVAKIPYAGKQVEAAWALGDAIALNP